MRLDGWERASTQLFCEQVRRGEKASTTPALASEQHLLNALQPLDAISRLVLEELDAEQLARALARQLVAIFNVEIATVALGDEKVIDEVTTCHENGGESKELDEATSTLLLWLGKRRHCFLANDSLAPLPFANQALESVAWRNLLGLPIFDHRGRVLGAIVLINRHTGPFTSLDLRLSEILARQVAVGFERALMISRLDDWTQGLQALLSFNAEINQHLEPNALIRHLIEHAARFLKADGGMAGLKEGHRQEARMVSSAYWQNGTWHESPRSWKVGEGLAGHLLDSEFPYLANDYPNDPKAELLYHQRFAVRSSLCVPIKNSEEVAVGFFELHRRDDRSPFTWQDASFLESLANTTAVAIENAQLLDQLEVKSRQVRNLSAENVNRLEEERKHIARELHDEAGQALVGIKLGLKVMGRLLPEGPSAQQEQLQELGQQVDHATGRLKDLAQRLRPPILDRLGLDVALEQLVEDYSERTGIVVSLSLAWTSKRQPAAVETALFRIAQEALTNVANHAQTRYVEVLLEADSEQVGLTITDQGLGFDLESVDRGLGLLGMRERVSMLGGRFEVDTGPSEGTCIRVMIPQTEAP